MHEQPEHCSGRPRPAGTYAQHLPNSLAEPRDYLPMVNSSGSEATGACYV